MKQPEKYAGYEVHPLASLWPLISTEKIYDSIEIDGVINAVVLDQNGRLVDGRNRARVWEEVAANNREGLPRSEWWETSHPLPVIRREFEDDHAVWDFIRAVNEKRRHLTPDQLAAVHATADSYFADAAKAKEAAQFKPGQSGNPTGKAKEQVDTNSCPPATEEPKRDIQEKHARSTVGRIAEAAGVSHHKAAQAVAVKKADPELLDKVAKGEVRLKDAVKEVAPPRQPRPRKIAEVVAPDGEVVLGESFEPVIEDPLDICLVQLDRMTRNELMILRDECSKRI